MGILDKRFYVPKKNWHNAKNDKNDKNTKRRQNGKTIRWYNEPWLNRGQNVSCYKCV